MAQSTAKVRTERARQVLRESHRESRSIRAGGSAEWKRVCVRRVRMPLVELEADGTAAALPEFCSSQVACAVARTALRRRWQLIRASDRAINQLVRQQQ